uniref:Uncharacterized protein n=1 Tax=Trichogramma kaykai TaxID=54128 RepID=A0ABD2VYM4_9HYME
MCKRRVISNISDSDGENLARHTPAWRLTKVARKNCPLNPNVFNSVPVNLYEDNIDCIGKIHVFIAAPSSAQYYIIFLCSSHSFSRAGDAIRNKSSALLSEYRGGPTSQTRTLASPGSMLQDAGVFAAAVFSSRARTYARSERVHQRPAAVIGLDASSSSATRYPIIYQSTELSRTCSCSCLSILHRYISVIFFSLER